MSRLPALPSPPLPSLFSLSPLLPLSLLSSLVCPPSPFSLPCPFLPLSFLSSPSSPSRHPPPASHRAHAGEDERGEREGDQPTAQTASTVGRGQAEKKRRAEAARALGKEIQLAGAARSNKEPHIAQKQAKTPQPQGSEGRSRRGRRKESREMGERRGEGRDEGRDERERRVRGGGGAGGIRKEGCVRVVTLGRDRNLRK